MPDPNYTHLSVLVDRSGSMRGLEKDMIGGMQALFDEQAKLEGKCLTDYAMFDTEYEQVFSDTLVASAKPVLEPRGMTALLDAIGKTITELDTKIKSMPYDERPSKRLMVIVTDGYENSSKEFTKDQIKTMIDKKLAKKKYPWEFIFLGANMDAVAEAASMGIPMASSMTYDTSHIGATTSNLSSYVTRSRSGVKDNAFSDEERKTSVDSKS